MSVTQKQKAALILSHAQTRNNIEAQIALIEDNIATLQASTEDTVVTTYEQINITAQRTDIISQLQAQLTANQTELAELDAEIDLMYDVIDGE